MLFIFNVQFPKMYDRQIKYFRLYCDRLQQYSPQASILVFIHQIDRIPPLELDKTCERIETELREEIKDIRLRKLEFYPTTLFSSSLFTGITACFQDWLPVGISLEKFKEQIWHKPQIQQYLWALQSHGLIAKERDVDKLTSLWEKPLSDSKRNSGLEEWHQVHEGIVIGQSKAEVISKMIEMEKKMDQIVKKKQIEENSANKQSK